MKSEGEDLVLPNARDLLAAQLKQFEEEDKKLEEENKKVELENRIEQAEKNLLAKFIVVAGDYFRVCCGGRLEKMNRAELKALNEMMMERSGRYLWYDFLKRKIAPVACFLGSIAGIVCVVISTTFFGDVAYGFLLFVLSMCFIIGGVFGGIALLKLNKSVWKEYCDETMFLKKLKGNDYFPIEKLRAKLGIAAPDKNEIPPGPSDDDVANL